MSMQYRRKPDNSVELINLRRDFTDPEFEGHKVKTDNEIGALSDEISALKHAELPLDATPEQEQAVGEFNMGVEMEMDSIKERRKVLLGERAMMEGV